MQRRAQQAETNVTGPQSAPATSRLALPVLLFIVALVVPVVLPIGGLRLSPYRILLLVMLLPLVLAWLSGKGGKIRLADISLILLCGWMTISTAMVHDVPTAIEAGGMFAIETLGAYFLARIYIRSADQFQKVATLLFLIVMFLLPFAVVEALTGRNIILEIFNAVSPSHGIMRKEQRLGLERVQSAFEHPILFGVFCGAMVALTYKVVGYGKLFLTKVAMTSLVIATAFLSLSSGPLTGITAQILLIGYDVTFGFLRSRWLLLAMSGGAIGFVLELLSNRSLPQIFIQYFSFNQYTAFLRLLIWHFGKISILAHPLFGIGFYEYERPPWMSASVDMFWIVFAIRHGIPAWIFTFLAFFAILIPVMFKKIEDPKVAQFRVGFVIAMIGLFLSGWTVHFWNATYVLFIFLLGCGAWILDHKDAGTDDDKTRDPAPIAEEPSMMERDGKVGSDRRPAVPARRRVGAVPSRPERRQRQRRRHAG